LTLSIGHTKSDNSMDRCWLKGAIGDALHPLSCAAGYNIRWLLRAIARLGPKLVFLRLLMAATTATTNVKSSCTSLPATFVRSIPEWSRRLKPASLALPAQFEYCRPH